MGKTKKVKSHKKKVNPIGLNSEAEIDQNESSDQCGPVELVMEQLESPSTDEKLNGLQLLATLGQNNQSISAIMQSNVIRIAGPFLVDPNLRLATSGAFRNLATCGLEVCDAMVEQDLLTPLLALLNGFENDWTPTSIPDEKSRLDERAETFLNAINILWNLCESSSEALDLFNNSQLLNKLIKGLNDCVFGVEISIATAQLLLVISEDNPASWKILHQHESELLGLLRIESGNFPKTLLKTLSAGIIANCPSLSGQYMQQVIASLGETFSANHRPVLNELSSEVPLEHELENGANKQEIDVEMVNEETEQETEDSANLRRKKADQLSDIEVKIKNIGFLLEAQRVGAEILTNITSYDEENKTYDDEDLDSETESVHDYDTLATSKENLTADKFPIEILEGIKSLNLVEKLWERAQPIAENVFQILNKRDPNLMKKLKLLRISSLLCLHNLCNGMSTEDLGGAQGIYKVWLDLGQQIFQNSNSDVHLLEASTALMRATLEHLKKNPELFAQITDNDLQMMLDGFKSCEEAEIRANWLKMLGTLGCLLDERLVKSVLAFILEACANEEDAWTISEAMDALMDMFSDNDWHQISFELSLPQKIKDLERILKNKLRQQKRELGERYSAVCTVRTNLARFSKYLESELRKYKAK